MPTVWLVVGRADGRIIGDLRIHGPPDSEGCVEIGYALDPSARGRGIGVLTRFQPRDDMLVGHLVGTAAQRYALQAAE